MSGTKMSAVMALFDSEFRDEMFLIMELAGLKNYTHFIRLHGSSDHGKKEGTVAWPGTNEIMMLLVSQEQMEKLLSEVRKLKAERTPPPPLLLFSWGLQEFI